MRRCRPTLVGKNGKIRCQLHVSAQDLALYGLVTGDSALSIKQAAEKLGLNYHTAQHAVARVREFKRNERLAAGVTT